MNVLLVIVAITLLSNAALPASAEEPARAPASSHAPLTSESTAPSASSDRWKDWHYGVYLDLSYIVNFNFPENHQWRSRTTSNRFNELAPNMGLVYVRKDATTDSRWGMELGAQGGYDSKDFAFLVNEPEVGGADMLRHVHRANVSYLAPVGKGLTIQAGLFNSLIGYESL